MSYTLTPGEQQTLQALYDQGPTRDNQPGNFVPLYTKLSEILHQRFADGTLQPNDPIRYSLLWLDVAIGANGGVGIHSAFIREFTNRQGILRLGYDFNTYVVAGHTILQESSNAVARNFFGNLQTNNWQIPTIDRIAVDDASAIGQVLYKGVVDPQDTAFAVNAGWSGTIGFTDGQLFEIQALADQAQRLDPASVGA